MREVRRQQVHKAFYFEEVWKLKVQMATLRRFLRTSNLLRSSLVQTSSIHSNGNMGLVAMSSHAKGAKVRFSSQSQSLCKIELESLVSSSSVWEAGTILEPILSRGPASLSSFGGSLGSSMVFFVGVELFAGCFFFGDVRFSLGEYFESGCLYMLGNRRRKRSLIWPHDLLSKFNVGSLSMRFH